MSPLLNTLSRFVIAFLPRSKHLLISWLQSPSAEILEPKKRKPITTSTFSPLFAMGLDAMILVYGFLKYLVLSWLFSLSFTLIKRLFSSSLLSAIRVVSATYLWLFVCLSWQYLFQLVNHPAWHFSRCTLHRI